MKKIYRCPTKSLHRDGAEVVGRLKPDNGTQDIIRMRGGDVESAQVRMLIDTAAEAEWSESMSGSIGAPICWSCVTA